MRKRQEKIELNGLLKNKKYDHVSGLHGYESFILTLYDLVLKTLKHVIGIIWLTQRVR